MSDRTSQLTKMFNRRKTPRRRRAFIPAPVGVVALEPRIVQSTSVLSQGILTVTGTADDDTINVVESSSAITADGKAFAVGSVNSIVVNGLDGNDTIIVTSKKPATLDGGVGNDALTATSGNDRLLGRDGTNTYPGVAASDIVVDPWLTNGKAINKAIMDKELALGGGPKSFLWTPTTDQVTAGGVSSVESYGGAIYWTPSTGALVVTGDIQAKYKALGGPSGVLGLPTADQQTAGWVEWCNFQNGTIVDTPSSPAYVLYGSIRDKYVALGGARGKLGLPLGDELSSPAGRVNEFQGGIIVTSSTYGPAFELDGAIKDTYYAFGGGIGMLGLPVGDQALGSDGWVRCKFQGGELIWQQSAGVHLTVNRGEVMKALKLSERDYVLDGLEYNFFKSIANDQNVYVDDITRFLTGRLINGDTANATAEGKVVGNLAPNSSAFKVDELERKWFEGVDHPVDSFTRTNPNGTTTNVNGGPYRLANGPLFGPSGPLYTDVAQGAVGDCFFLAALADAAYRNPTLIRSMFTDNGDGTFTVRFVKGTSQYVTVDRMLPSAGSTFASTAPGPIWVALAEKAYAQVNESGWLSSSLPSTNSYASMDGGSTNVALTALTGMTTTSIVPNIANAWNAGALVVLNTATPANPLLVPSHTYVVVGYNSSTKTYRLFNPWGVNGGFLNGTKLPGYVYETQASISTDFVNASRTSSTQDQVTPAAVARLVAAPATVRPAFQDVAEAPEGVGSGAVVALRPHGGRARVVRGPWASRRWATGPNA